MTATHANQIIDGYLARLEAELAGVPAPRRRELLDDVRAHLSEARAALPEETDADLLNILDRLGDAADLAAEHRQRLGLPAPAPFRPGLMEIGALVLTPLLWPVGVVLLWASAAWNWRDKLIGTLIPPGGYFGVSMLLVASLGLAKVCPVARDSVGRVVSDCPHPAPILQAVGAVILVLVVASPLLSALYLAFRLW